MQELLQHSLKNGLKGSFSHANPVEAISELEVETAKTRLEGKSHSIWEILYHIVFWQDIFIENINGNDPKWDDEGSWPKEEEMQEDKNFKKLQERFKEGKEEIERLIESTDLDEKLVYCR
ncbi:MAG: DinB family protein, partial [Candidatus Heimdallarchaeaceae archaeon]